MFKKKKKKIMHIVVRIYLSLRYEMIAATQYYKSWDPVIFKQVRTQPQFYSVTRAY